MSDDWLSIDPPSTVPAWHHSKHPEKARKKYTPAVHDNSFAKKRSELLELKRVLPQPQRDYLDCLTQQGFHRGNAQLAMVAKGYLYDRSTFTRWCSKPQLKRAIELAEEEALEKANVSAAKVILRVDRLAEYALDEIPLRDKHGNLQYDPEDVEQKHPIKIVRDPELALKANELLGKNKKLWGNDEGSVRVTVQVIDLAGDNAAPIMDGEFTTVAEDDN